MMLYLTPERLNLVIDGLIKLQLCSEDRLEKDIIMAILIEINSDEVAHPQGFVYTLYNNGLTDKIEKRA
jgi:hypothetical protein